MLATIIPVDIDTFIFSINKKIPRTHSFTACVPKGDNSNILLNKLIYREIGNVNTIWRSTLLTEYINNSGIDQYYRIEYSYPTDNNLIKKMK